MAQRFSSNERTFVEECARAELRVDGRAPMQRRQLRVQVLPRSGSGGSSGMLRNGREHTTLSGAVLVSARVVAGTVQAIIMSLAYSCDCWCRGCWPSSCS